MDVGLWKLRMPMILTLWVGVGNGVRLVAMLV